MRAQVSYMVPVEVVVDLDSGEVDQVVVIDEMIVLDRDDAAKDGKAIHAEGYTELADPVARKRALEIAENEEWPAWEHGF
jgi:hypothetical protein